jgi:hypothetical protein
MNEQNPPTIVLAKSSGESDDAFAKRITTEYHAWLDELAERDVAHAASIAKVNRESVGHWGETWLVKHGITDTNVSALAKRQAAEHAFEGARAAFAKATGNDSINAFLADASNLELYRDLCRATNEAEVASGAVRYVPAVDVAKRDSAYEALERGLTAFCKAKNIAKPWTDGLEKYRETDEGRALSDAYNEAAL